MSKDKLQPGRKEHDGKMSKTPFQAIDRCQSFVSLLYIYMAKAEKEYRNNICRKLQDLGCEMIHSARLANSIKLHDPNRQEVHAQTIEYMEKINDLLPVLRRCRCISINQESELQKKLGSIKWGYNKWIESDIRRLQSDGTLKKQ